MDNAESSIVTTITELRRIAQCPVILSDSATTDRVFAEVFEKARQPAGWLSADEAFEDSEGFTGRVLTNGRSSRQESARRADTIVFLAYRSSEEIDLNDVTIAAHREAGSGTLVSPIVSRRGSSVLVEGSYVSEGIALHSLTRYHLGDDHRTLSQITVTTASQSEVDPATRDWLLGLDHAHEQK